MYLLMRHLFVSPVSLCVCVFVCICAFVCVSLFVIDSDTHGCHTSMMVSDLFFF